jgi:thiamine-monophosphate kinase
VGLTVGLAAPAETPWTWVEGVYGGLSEALVHYGGTLLGGDCSGSQQRLLAITALGRLDPARPIRRRDGRPGDLLVSSGAHGLSRLGLALLQGELEPLGDPELQERAITAHRRPRPRLDGLAALTASQPPGEPWRVAGMDSSDGLGQAVAAIAKRSLCQAVLERHQLPLAAAMADLPQAEAWCLGGGEDFELVLALAPAWAEALVEQLVGAQVIGRLEPAQPSDVSGWVTRPLRWADGTALALTDAAGFSHFH